MRGCWVFVACLFPLVACAQIIIPEKKHYDSARDTIAFQKAVEHIRRLDAEAEARHIAREVEIRNLRLAIRKTRQQDAATIDVWAAYVQYRHGELGSHLPGTGWHVVNHHAAD